jgi:hypothetical protein
LGDLDRKYKNLRIINPNIFITDIVKTINRLRLPTKIASKKYRIDNTNDITRLLTGLYVLELDYENLPAIFLCIAIPNKNRLSNKNWVLTKRHIADIIEHELIHCRQMKNVDYDGANKTELDEDDELAKYLIDNYEIEAFSLNTARELLRSCRTYHRAMVILTDKNKHLKKYSPILWMYSKGLAKYPSDRKRYYQWVRLYLLRITEGTL